MSLKWDDNKVKQIAQAIDKRVKDCALDLQNKSVMIAPIETSNMRHSCVVEKTGNLEYTVKYDKSASCYTKGDGYYYAMRQHEDLSLRHKPGTQAKFLESPYNARKKLYETEIGKAIGAACSGTAYSEFTT